MTDREREFLAMRRELVDPDFGDEDPYRVTVINEYKTPNGIPVRFHLTLPEWTRPEVEQFLSSGVMNNGKHKRT
jgi:hypothetical protein